MQKMSRVCRERLWYAEIDRCAVRALAMLISCATASKRECAGGIAIVFLSFGVLTRRCLYKGAQDAVRRESLV
jgi:hypothetical protein